MEGSSRKTLSYEATKAVLKYMSFDKRHQVNCCIPQLRKTNTLLPYQFRFVRFAGYYSIILDDRDCSIDEGENVLKQCTIRHRHFCEPSSDHQERFRLDKSAEEAYKALFEAYIKNGTKIQKLVVLCVPSCLAEKLPENFKIEAVKITISVHNLEDCNKLLSFIDEKSLEQIKFRFDKQLAPVLESSLIKNCPRLYISSFNLNLFPWNQLHVFENKYLQVSCIDFPIPDLQDLVASWKQSHRPIGSVFVIMASARFKFNFLMSSLKVHLGAVSSKLPRLGNSSNVNCVTMKMNNGNDTELVVSIESKHKKVQMEVVKAGTSISDV